MTRRYCFALDLKDEADRDRFLSLVTKADVVVESFRPGVMDKLGLGYDTLKAVNERLWEIEDNIRRQEAAGTFGEEFIRLARSVYEENDERARLKYELNQRLGSDLIEEKDYPDYTGSSS